MTAALVLKSPLFDLYPGRGKSSGITAFPTALSILSFSQQTVLSVRAWPVTSLQEEKNPPGSAVTLNPGSRSDVSANPASSREYLR